MDLAGKNIQIGTIESIDDSNFSGRVKVRVKGLHDSIPTEKLPWCTFAGTNIFSGKGGGAISIPRVGTEVRVKFKNNDVNSMEFVGPAHLDKELINELATDYEGSHVLVYDSDADFSIMFQPNSGLRLYYKGSNIQITPDNNIMIHYGESTSGTQIQLAEGEINIQSNEKINLTTTANINLEATNGEICLDGKNAVQLRGNSAKNEVAVNGNALVDLLYALCTLLDAKVPNSGAKAVNIVNMYKHKILNTNIQYLS